jgi:hypothetical protein
MRLIDALLASYLDLARHLDPLRYPEEAPPEIRHRLGRFDEASQHAHAKALRSIANAIEDLDDIDALDDEVDRTMLINTIRCDIARVEGMAASDSANPCVAMVHLSDALYDLMGEDFDAECDAALRERIAAFGGFLEALREDMRPAGPIALLGAKVEADLFDDGALAIAAERLDDASVQPALVAIAEHRHWLEEPAREGGTEGMGEEPVAAQLATMVSEPLGVKGTLRLLELRRAGVERSLASAAAELGDEDPMACARRLLEEAQPSQDIFVDFWDDELQRVAGEMQDLGLPVMLPDPTPDPPLDASDGWSMASYAVREYAAQMLEEARASNARPVRRVLCPDGLVEGWGRTVAALLRSTDVFGLPERRVMMSFLALRESATAEVDLLLHARMATLDELSERMQQTAGVNESGARAILGEVVAYPLRALGAGLAHEAWQSWYAEVGGEPVPFMLKAMQAGGLAVPLARWAMEQG